MFKYLRLVFQVGFYGLFQYTFYIWRYARHPERTPLEKRYKKVRQLMRFIIDHYRVDWHVKGLDNLETLCKSDKSFLIVSNHMSDLDAMTVAYYCEKPLSFIAKKEAKKFPFVGAAIKAIDGVFLDRGNLRQNVVAMKKVEENLENNRCSYLIYPEGTRNRNPLAPTAPFHAGSLKPAFRSSCPLIALATYGTQRPFHPSTNYKRYPVAMTFFPPLSAEDRQKENTTTLALRLHNEIAEEVYHLRAEDGRFFLEDKEKTPLKKKS